MAARKRRIIGDFGDNSLEDTRSWVVLWIGDNGVDVVVLLLAKSVPKVPPFETNNRIYSL